MLTPEETEEALLLEKQAAELQKVKTSIRKAQANLANRIFQRVLAAGKWKLDHGMLLFPEDSATKEALVDLLSDALGLGHHGQFFLEFDDTKVHGYVDDGEIRLLIQKGKDYPTPSEVVNTLKTLRVNCEILPWFRKATNEALRSKEIDVKIAQGKVDALRKALDEMEG